ncbi:ABC transporter substrate-binding protein, partial [Streptomyces sp. MCAF7]
MRHARRRQLVSALLLAPLLSGCFAAADNSSRSGSGADTRLRVALAFPPAENFSPYGSDATLLSRLGVTEGLTRLDGNGAASPALAESWRQENEHTWLFTLREARFQDGTDLTPAAAATALTRAAQADPAPAALSGVKLTAEPAGKRQVRVTTADPDPALPLRLSSPSLAVLSAKAYREEGTVDPVSTATGPFVLTKAGGGNRATLNRFDDYWGGRARASGIDARFIADGTARTNALRTGEVDIAEAVPVAQTSSLDKGTARELATTRTTSLLLNTRSGPFKDPKVRAAARAAVDTSVLAK